ncbi:MAG: type III-A CRISPR-associated protein Csm2 [Syntrophaceae bacterium]|nr:type III-A CRISPR-associated protein Csm2 [Syntrophaceae bacterium]
MKDLKGPRPEKEKKVEGGVQQVDEDKLRRILGGDAKELNSYANELAKSYLNARKESEKLTTSQIRNVLDELQRMREFDEAALHLIRPKLAYAAGRHGGRVKDFQKLLDTTIKITNRENFKNFKNFVEAIVAYHRYYGGK